MKAYVRLPRRADKHFNKLVLKPVLDRAGKLFERHGREAILFGRFVPGTGAPISVLAGIKRMTILQFTAYTAFGNVLWNVAFIGLGWELGTQWPLVKQYASTIEYVVLAAVAVGCILWIPWRQWKMYTQLLQYIHGRLGPSNYRGDLPCFRDLPGGLCRRATRRTTARR
ncbi:MAG: VTT domain-containing protein [Rubrobacter sp.]|nr:VTT domain-containing protein [Rubrobacter sp.]